MGTRTKVMKTTKNVTVKIILKMIPKISFLFHPVAKIDQLLANVSIV